MSAIAWILAAAALRASAAHATPVPSCESGQVVTLPIAEALSIESPDPGMRWIDIDEDGVDVAISAGASEISEVTVPPRYGRFRVRIERGTSIEVRRSPPSGWPSRLRITTHCSDPAARSDTRWFAKAADLSGKLLPVPQSNPEELLPRIAALRASCADPVCEAQSEHLRAQALYAAGDTVSAGEAFAGAQRAWLSAGDDARALAALTGRVEELIRAARYTEALSLSHPGFGSAELSQTYFAVRLQAAECLVREYLGDLQSAASCYQSVASRQRHDTAEVASTLVNLASVQYLAGDAAGAERNATNAKTIAEGPYAPIVRGRASLLLADVDTDRADLSKAFSHFDEALAEFTAVNETRWEANVLLRAASLYGQMGAIEEALAFTSVATDLFPENSAPARVAAARVVSARSYLRVRRNTEALDAARSAADTYANLKMPVELDIARSLVARAELGLGDIDAAADLYRDRNLASRLSARPWALIAARIDLLRNDLPAARRKLDALKHGALSLNDQIDKVAIEAGLLSERGDHDAALTKILDTTRRVRGLARRMHSLLLANVVLGQTAPLQEFAADLLIERTRNLPDEEEETTRAAWRLFWLARGRAGSGAADEASPRADAAFDEFVAHQLLNPERKRRDRPADMRALLNVFAHASVKASPDAAGESVPPISMLQAALPEKTLFVAYLGGSKEGLVLWISATSATVAAVPDIAGLREDAKALSTLAADVDASMSRIQSAAAALSLRVFESAPGPQPSRLLVDAGDDLATVPWTLLRWPGSDTELLDHTAISHVRLEKRCCQLSSSRGLPQRVDVLVSSPDAATSGLSMLQMAASESRLISLALGKRMQANVMPVADKQTILDALSGSDRWIHIVAHGSTRPDRVGFNGIWLDAPGGNVITPSFLSGIDLLNGIVRTDLVVLSACALGRRASNPLQPSMSFADMATMAGAAHVISSLWPISDSATVVWVPAFYREAARGGEFDDALRGAQLALKASRQFRHPFFWAPFVHQERLILEPSAAAAAGALASVSRMP